MDAQRLPGLRINVIALSAIFALLFAILLAAGALAFRQTAAQAQVRHSLDVINGLNRILTELLDAETGQRGFIITGDGRYLEPFNRAAPQVLRDIDGLGPQVAAEERGALADLHAAAQAKIDELHATVDLKATGRVDDALARVRQGEGRETMDRARRTIAQLLDAEERRLSSGRAEAVIADGAIQIGIVAAVVAVIAMGIVGLAALRRQFHQVVEARRVAELANERWLAENAERERIGETLRHVQKLESLGQLTGGIAHDFNNMLAVILGNLSLLQKRLIGREAVILRFIENAIDAVNRAAALTSRLLAFARQQPLSPQPIDGNKFIAALADLLRRTLGEQIRLETVLGGGLWRAYLDTSELENAIVNLAVNARDAMPEGGKLTIETANVFLDEAYATDHGITPGQYVMIAVTDSGCGMPPQTLAKAFDPFFTTKEGTGTGLGLSQVYGFVKQSGGHIKVYSEIGEGTTVKLYVPRYLGPEAASPAAKPERVSAPRGRPHEAVLVVEDDDRVREVTAQLVADLGYTAYQANGAAAALDVLAQHPDIGLLFTDVVMPDVNGRALAEQALQRRPGLKVIFTTGFTRNAIIHNGVLDPGVTLITKPFTPDVLAHKLRGAFDA